MKEKASLCLTLILTPVCTWLITWGHFSSKDFCLIHCTGWNMHRECSSLFSNFHLYTTPRSFLLLHTIPTLQWKPLFPSPFFSMTSICALMTGMSLQLQQFPFYLCIILFGSPFPSIYSSLLQLLLSKLRAPIKK